MAFALSRKDIHCPNCHFEGVAKITSSGGGLALSIIAAIFLIVGLFVALAFVIIAIFLFIIAAFMPAKHICPKCQWHHPIPLKQWRMQQQNYLR